jgi:hypothetical protein
VVRELCDLHHEVTARRVLEARTVAEIASASLPSRSYLSPSVRRVLWPEAREERPS